MIWKHSVTILTGVDGTVSYLKQGKGDISSRLETLLKSWTCQIQLALASSIGDKENITRSDAVTRPAGSEEEPDLLKPHEKWFHKFGMAAFHPPNLIQCLQL